MCAESGRYALIFYPHVNNVWSHTHKHQCTIPQTFVVALFTRGSFQAEGLNSSSFVFCPCSSSFIAAFQVYIGPGLVMIIIIATHGLSGFNLWLDHSGHFYHPRPSVPTLMLIYLKNLFSDEP